MSVTEMKIFLTTSVEKTKSKSKITSYFHTSNIFRKPRVARIRRCLRFTNIFDTFQEKPGQTFLPYIS